MKINKEELLELLDDEDIQKKIKKIIKHNAKKEELNTIIKQKDEEIEMLKETIKKLKSFICDKNEKIENLKTTNISQTNELQNMKKEYLDLIEKNKKLNKKLNFYEKFFKEDSAIYELFNSLNENTKNGISSIFKDETLKGFLACGMQEKNIEALWEYIKYKIIENKPEDLEKLIKIFDFFFDRFILANPLYEREMPKGEFDTQKHINISSFNPSGEIDEVIFRGYKNTKTNKIIKKSIVKVK